ncbi:MAG: WD40 repeat protein [Alteromonadaceae bacterium]|jgi:WD40 repeat protein
MQFLSLFILSFLLIGCGQSNTFSSNALTQFKQSTELVAAADISSDGKYSLIADPERVCVWNNLTSQLQHGCLVGEEKNYIEIVKISENNAYYLTSNQIVVRLYHLSNGEKVGEWRLGENIINDIALSKNADVILLGLRSGKAGIIRPFINKVFTFKKHRLDINSVAISHDGITAFTGSSDKTAMLWHTQTGKNSYSLKHKSRVNHVQISDDGKIGVTIDSINDHNIWNLETGETLSELDTHLRFFEFNHSKFSSDNKLLLSGSPKQKLQLWRVSDGALIGQWQAYQESSRASVLATSLNDQHQAMSMTTGGMLETWDLPPK